MYNPGSVGYQVHIRRKRPGLIIFIIFIISGTVSFISFKADIKFSHISTFFIDKSKKEDNSNPKNVLPEIDAKSYRSIASLSPAKFGSINIPGKEVVNEPILIDSKVSVILNTSENKRKQESDTLKKPTETIFSETEYFNFGIGTSGMNNSNQENIMVSPDSVKYKKTWFYVIVSSVDTKETADQQKNKFIQLFPLCDYIYIPSLNKYRIYIGKYSSMKEASIKSNAFMKQYPAIKPWIWKNPNEFSKH